MADEYGLIGWPLGHSFSKAFFTERFAADGSGRSYTNYPVEHLTGEWWRELLASHPALKGINVTAPHKIDIMPFLSRIDPAAAAVGAVNTVLISRDERGRVLSTTGFNTDVTGLQSALKPLLRPNHRNALILGTGGASLAAVEACRRLGLSPARVSRTPGRADLAYDQLTPEVIASNTIIINATPLGTYPDTQGCAPIPYHLVTPSHRCFDMVYNPAETTFMRLCRARGATVANGKEMLVGQALAALRIWES